MKKCSRDGMVDLAVSKTVAEKRVGSNPIGNTKINFIILTKEEIENDRSKAYKYLL